MGNKSISEESSNSKLDMSHHKGLLEETLSRNSFEYISIIGRGGFGKVWRVSCRKYNKTYAMKEMSKTKIIDKHSEKSIKYERDLLHRMKHPFIINMHFSFQDNDNWYLVMDLLTGGDLRYHICKQQRFTEEQTQFFIACILLGLEYCHMNHVIHRDIKPENLVLDEKGYVKITDFGIAKIEQPNNSKETSGTPGYMSPEVMWAQNHTIAVDYFAVGVIGFEFMKGIRPYLGKTRKEIKEKIIGHQAQIKKHEIPFGWSIEAADCINKLLQRKPLNRWGNTGASEVKQHSWFKNFNWKDWYNGNYQSPFIPKNCDNFDYKYCNANEQLGLPTQERYTLIKSSSTYSTVFNDYVYFNREYWNRNRLEINDMFYNPHTWYENEQETTERGTAHSRIKSAEIYNSTNVNNYRKGGHGSSGSMDMCNNSKAFCEANFYVMKRTSIKKSMSSKGNNSSNNMSSDGQGTGPGVTGGLLSNNSTGLNCGKV